MYVMNRLEALEVVSFQLAPSPDSGILDDPALISRGHIRLGDCWAEVEKCYIEAVKVLLRHRRTWSGEDERHEMELRGARGPVSPSVMESAQWPVPLQRLRKFVSLDEKTTSIVEHLEKTIADLAPGWKKTDVASWELDQDPSRETSHKMSLYPNLEPEYIDALIEP